jgi:hypothetical protein
MPGGMTPRRLLIGAAAAVAVIAIISVPFVLNRGDMGAPSIPAAQIPSRAERQAAAEAEAEPRRRVLPPAHGIYLGVSNLSLAGGESTVDDWTREHGVRPRIVGWYQQWLSGEQRFRTDWALRVSRQGAVPMITWEPWSAPQGEIHTALQPEIDLQRIADGAHDAYIRRYARTVAAYGQPVLIRMAHEMNGTWYPWGVHVNGNTPALYVRAWRHVHRIFDAAGADNVSWVWSINNLEGRPGETVDISQYYPGPRWVDWVSTSGFNWGDAYSWSSWRTADSLYGATYTALSAFGKPIMISEIGTTGSGGDPHAWIGQALRTLRTSYPLLRAVVFYDDIDGGGLDFRLRGPTAHAISQPGALGHEWLQHLRLKRLG